MLVIFYSVSQVRHWFACQWITMETGTTLSYVGKLVTQSTTPLLEGMEGETYTKRDQTSWQMINISVKGSMVDFLPVSALSHTPHKEPRQTNQSPGQSLQQILESVCLGLFLPLITPLSAKNVLLVQQKLAMLYQQ